MKINCQGDYLYLGEPETWEYAEVNNGKFTGSYLAELGLLTINQGGYG
jgi:hypothetical protein